MLDGINIMSRARRHQPGILRFRILCARKRPYQRKGSARRTGRSVFAVTSDRLEIGRQASRNRRFIKVVGAVLSPSQYAFAGACVVEVSAWSTLIRRATPVLSRVPPPSPAQAKDSLRLHRKPAAICTIIIGASPGRLKDENEVHVIGEFPQSRNAAKSSKMLIMRRAWVLRTESRL